MYDMANEIRKVGYMGITKKIMFAAIAGTAIAVFLLYVMSSWNRRDEMFLTSFDSIDDLMSSDVGESTWKTTFRQNDMDYIGVRYRVRKLPPRFLSRWLLEVNAPCLIFNAKGLCVDKSCNYNDDHLFIHRWPALFPYVKSCKCGWENHVDTARK